MSRLRDKYINVIYIYTRLACALKQCLSISNVSITSALTIIFFRLKIIFDVSDGSLSGEATSG